MLIFADFLSRIYKNISHYAPFRLVFIGYIAQIPVSHAVPPGAAYHRM
ncbi:hypothetical protein HMPREF9436_02486 [Faecalibacterium cf. prausnitzii KLE1255]|uniref:Uncharacterized protein n=1 Tax=Faecalibacterium cf. prausnitzii KLE1255 TaxID=748224 RepID=E2ZLD0_9FIRM|nr:hypothetical protein HMPREF9436_02486 [Faecalibacterium cf. prausnitzii KLE1255]